MLNALSKFTHFLASASFAWQGPFFPSLANVILRQIEYDNDDDDQSGDEMAAVSRSTKLAGGHRLYHRHREANQQEVSKLKKKSTVDEVSNIDNAREKNSSPSATRLRRMAERCRKSTKCCCQSYSKDNNAKERVADF